MRELTDEEKEQRKRMDERLKGRKIEPCPESDFMICCEEDFNHE